MRVENGEWRVENWEDEGWDWDMWSKKWACLSKQSFRVQMLSSSSPFLKLFHNW